MNDEQKNTPTNNLGGAFFTVEDDGTITGIPFNMDLNNNAEEDLSENDEPQSPRLW